MKTRRNWIWFFIKLIPLITVLLYCFVMIAAKNQSNEVPTVRDFAYNINDLLISFYVPGIYNGIAMIARYFVTSDVFLTAFGFAAVLKYVSYLVFVEILRIMYEVLVFLPKFANSFFERKLGD